MSSQRIVRVNAILHREIAESLYRVMGEDFDHAAVTIVRVITSADLHHARVMVSIRATPERQQQLLGMLRHRRIEVQAYFSRHVKLRYTPQLIFQLDESLAEGDHVLRMIETMEAAHPEQFELPPEEPPADTDAAGTEPADEK